VERISQFGKLLDALPGAALSFAPLALTLHPSRI
jgi:hypothetical protein